MYTPDPSDFIARVLRWIDRRRPAQVPREMLDPEADGYVSRLLQHIRVRVMISPALTACFLCR
jgi:hypothetical protein